jgi:transposase-like protein
MTQLPSEKLALFKGRHFNHLLIIQAVRWYVTYKLSYLDVCDLMTAAVRFFKKAIGNNEVPEKIAIGGSQASHQAVADLKAEGVLPAQTLVRTNKYLNNMIEQDHRRVKQRYYPMLWFKAFGNAKVTLSGIELANKIKKRPFNASEITNPGAMILQVWEAALAA